MTKQAKKAAQDELPAAAAVTQGANEVEDCKTIVTETKFSFRASKVINADSTVTVIPAPPAVILELPYITTYGLQVALADDPKVLEYAVELANSAIYLAAREQVTAFYESEQGKQRQITQTDLDNSKLTILALATAPKAEYRGVGIPKELWQAFTEDYCQVMADLYPTRDADKIARQAEILAARLEPARAKPKVLEFLVGNCLAGDWWPATTRQDEFQVIFDFLSEKGAKLRTPDESETLDSLM